jgi:hypothetical protein
MRELTGFGLAVRGAWAIADAALPAHAGDFPFVLLTEILGVPAEGHALFEEVGETDLRIPSFCQGAGGQAIVPPAKRK